MLAYFGEFCGNMKGRHAAVRPARFAAVALLSGVFLACAAARSAEGGDYTHTWTGGGGDGVWENADNWEQPTYPDGADDAALIDSGADEIAIAGARTLGALTLDADYSGTLTLGGTLTVDGATHSGNLNVNGGTLRTGRNVESGIDVAGTFTIGEDGVVVVRRSSTTANDGHGAGQTITAGDMVVHGVLQADGEGFLSGSGPGTTTGSSASRDGASHGGRGGDHGLPGYVGPAYGSVTDPVSLGSGGFSHGDHGGGAIDISVTGTLDVNGTISAEGIGVPSSGSGGSGGSIKIKTSLLTGSGTISANGGRCGSSYGSGGGGRIAIIQTGGSSWPLTVRAYGGSGGVRAAAGTIYLKGEDDSDGYGALVIDNNGVEAGYSAFTKLSDGGDTVHDFSSVKITGNGNLSIRYDDRLDIGLINLDVDSRSTSFLTISDATNVIFPDPFVVSNYTLCLDVPVSASGDWTIAGDGNLSHNRNYRTNGNIYKLDLTLDGDLTIDGEINVTGKGYIDGYGPGTTTGGTSSRDGASHGGRGGDHGDPGYLGPAYGSVTNPVLLGSGGYFSGSVGGGAIIISSVGTITLNGDITADGIGPSASGSGGSGGSINISAGSLTGNGKIQANGGNVPGYGSGGGGRIAIVQTEGMARPQNIEAFGGSTGIRGAAGTIYLETAAHTPGAGELRVNNTHATAAGTVTELPPSHPELSCPDELQRVTLIIEDKGKVGLTADITVGDLIIEQ